jgi:AAA domain
LEEKIGQIAHLDGDRTNAKSENLAWICLAHHSLFDSKTSQHKNYSLAEVKTARTKLYAAIRRRFHQDPVASRPVRVFTSKLSAVNSLLIGRDAELDFLAQSWADPKVNVVQIIAPAGTGKTALMDRWFRRHVNESTIFAWSFYSQGISENRQSSSDPFFSEVLRFFGVVLPEGASIWTRAEAIAAYLRKERVLLILDGLEPLQEPSGEVRDLPMRALLQELRARNQGMVLCTTRVWIALLMRSRHYR